MYFFYFHLLLLLSWPHYSVIMMQIKLFDHTACQFDSLNTLHMGVSFFEPTFLKVMVLLIPIIHYLYFPDTEKSRSPTYRSSNKIPTYDSMQKQVKLEALWRRNANSIQMINFIIRSNYANKLNTDHKDENLKFFDLIYHHMISGVLTIQRLIMSSLKCSTRPTVHISIHGVDIFIKHWRQ